MAIAYLIDRATGRRRVTPAGAAITPTPIRVIAPSTSRRRTKRW